MKNRKVYEIEAQKLAKAIDIAIEAFNKYIPENFEQKHLDHIINCYLEWKKEILNPEPKYRNLTSLKYKINDVFTLFQEDKGETVEYFWKRINESELDYKRVNKFGKIIKRGKIKGRIEYEYIIDMIVVAKQTKMINENEYKMLNEMLNEMINKYENIKN